MLALTLFALLSTQDRTTFQTGQPYRPGLDLRADAAIVYGFGNGMPDRVKSWRKKGYTVELMTGVAWGEYQDYLYGRFDGKNHEDEAQTRKDGSKISHGGDVYYMSPGPSYGKYLAAGVRRALAAGVEAVYLEEPEYWVAAGYSPSFKREWQDFYHETWQPPDDSTEAQWRASKLKYFLYRRALQQVFDDVQAYNRDTGKHVKCYVATHSLVNYSSWNIVSPESSLAKLQGCDGYIAQVWTGTARTPNYYGGQLAERTFDTAFLEYGAMMNVARATGKRLWLLADPVEDDPKHDWGDYRRNYQATLTASLLQPDVADYEVMPWPERVFGGDYPSEDNPSTKTKIPPAYAAVLQSIIQALGDMGNQPKGIWSNAGPGVGVVLSDSLMFERAGPTSSDPQLGHVFGLALPLLEHGIPVQPVQLETATAKDLAHYRMLLMTYRGMKPMTVNADAAIAAWVRRGGSLLFVDDDGDAFNGIREWWNSGEEHFSTPREHFFRELGVPNEPGEHRAGAGRVVWLKEDPAALSKNASGPAAIMDVVRKMAKDARLPWRESGHLLLKRGRYTIVAALASAGKPVVVRGRYIDLFDPSLALLADPQVDPGKQMFLLNPNVGADMSVLASACRAVPIEKSMLYAKFSVEGIDGTPGIVLMKCPYAPKSIMLAGRTVTDTHYDLADHLLWIRFENSATSRELTVNL